MGFGEVFSKSWKEFKEKFRLSSKFVFYFIIIPGILSLIFSSIYSYTQNLAYLMLTLCFGILSLFLGAFASTSFISSSIFNKKDYSSSSNLGKKFYWRYIGLFIIEFIFLVLLFFALIIPAIIFGVYWILSAYILIGENKGIIESLKGSFRLVKNHWWMVLGYTLLFWIIAWGIQIVFSIPSWPTGIMMFVDAFQHPDLYIEGAKATNIGLIHGGISGIFGLLSRFVVIPLSIIFYKNLYLKLKKK